MNQSNKIYSLSNQLRLLNSTLENDIVTIKSDEIMSSIGFQEGSSLVFEERHISNILKAVRMHGNLKTRFICVGKNLNSEDRLVLLNNNIECISPDKFSQISTVFFKVNSNICTYKVLVVEDDEDQIILTEHILKNANINVKSITKGQDVFPALETFQPDLILMDLYLDEMSGDEIVRNIRKDIKFTLLPVVFLTSDTSIETRMKVLNAGADDLLTKPINSALLVSALKNRMQRSNQTRRSLIDRGNNKDNSSDLSVNNKSIQSQILHDVGEDESKKTSDFISKNSNNKSASMIWVKLKDKRLLQKKLGYSGFKSLCSSIITKLPLFDYDFDIKIKLAEGVFFLASSKLDVNESKNTINESNKWLKNSSFSYQDENYFVELISVILNDIPAKKEIGLLMRKAENILIESHSKKDVIVLGDEDDKEFSFESIKQQLETSIKTRNFNWRYSKIVSNTDDALRIIKPHMVIMSDDDKELLHQDYLDVAIKSGMLRLLNRFLFEHAIRIIRGNEKNKTVVLIEQSLVDYHSKQLRHRFFEGIKNLNLEKNSVYFQFGLEDAKNHLDVISDIGAELKRANINICLSDFDTKKSSWDIARSLKTSWIALNKFTGTNDLDEDSKDNLSKVVNKAKILCYKTMATKIDTPELAQKLKDLKIDMIQGGYIKPLKSM